MDLTNIAKVMRGEFGDKKPHAEEAGAVEEAVSPSCALFNSIRDEAVRRKVYDDDTHFRLYIDSKLESVGDSSLVSEYVERKLCEYGLIKKEEPAAAETPTEEVVEEEAVEDPAVEEVVEDSAADTLEGVEAALRERGFDVKVSDYKIRTTPCVRVDVVGDADGLKRAMDSLGYAFKSKRKDAYYFLR